MIVRMKRVAVLCTAASEHETLDALQALGVLHLDADSHAEAPALKESQASLDSAVKALAVLGICNGISPRESRGVVAGAEGRREGSRAVIGEYAGWRVDLDGIGQTEANRVLFV